MQKYCEKLCLHLDGQPLEVKDFGVEVCGEACEVIGNKTGRLDVDHAAEIEDTGVPRPLKNAHRPRTPLGPYA